MPRRGVVIARPAGPPPMLEPIVDRVSRLLLPDPIADALLWESIDALVVVPVSLAYSYAEDEARARDLVAAIGSVPFALLRLGPGRRQSLVDVASVVVAPGFASLAGGSRTQGRRFTEPIVVGDPAIANDPDWHLPRLPFAAREADAVAQALGTAPLLGEAATRATLVERLRAQARTVDLIHLATHGVADAENPLDGSFLALARGRLTAREIGELRLEADPLVVMSACDTGLGKDFEVGTIGLARAWRRAGAASVVMSLWNVDDAATTRLMTACVGLAQRLPPDRALQCAMQQARDAGEDPGHWASFALFGVP